MVESRELRVERRDEALGAMREVRRFSSFPLPLSPFRLGISLTEVLIAMGIMTVGLLGVASVFPVGGWYMQRAEISDRGSAIAQSVMSDLVARGMLNPGAWFTMTPIPAPAAGATTSPNYQFLSIDGKYTQARVPIPGTFTRPFAETLLQGLKLNTTPTIISQQFGNAYAIDPVYAAAAASTISNVNNASAYPFPATAYSQAPWTSAASVYYKNAGWDPWRSNPGAKEKAWPIRRVTFQQPNGLPLDKALADNISRVSDDLATDLPARDDRPVSQSWDVDATSGAPLARKWTGDYSWIATVVPTTNAARDGMARNPEGFDYDVSVVVFYKRPLPIAVPNTPSDIQEAVSHEREVGAKIISTGPNGGQILLTDMNDVFDRSAKPVSPFDQLKVGQWIMLCGPHPNSSLTEPRFVMNWYQVLSVEGTNSKLNAYGSDSPPAPAGDPDRRLITVRGVQWPWQPATDPTYTTGLNSLSNDLCVGIFKGAVAVHSKTLRLESQSGNAFGSGMSTFTPPNVPPGFIVY
jgi:hypothetical protein